jgi:hypothetical protein
MGSHSKAKPADPTVLTRTLHILEFAEEERGKTVYVAICRQNEKRRERSVKRNRKCDCAVKHIRKLHRKDAGIRIASFFVWLLPQWLILPADGISYCLCKYGHFEDFSIKESNPSEAYRFWYN